MASRRMTGTGRSLHCTNMEVALLAIALSLFYTIADSKGALPAGRQVQGLSQCVGNTLHLGCPEGSLIHILQVFYGQSNQGCAYDPKGCVRQEVGFHTCTGQQLCDWSVPHKKIPECGLADYVSVTQRCLPASNIEDICSAPRLTNHSGYISSPQYPAPLPITQHTCQTSITLKNRQDVILFYMYDLGDGDCKGTLVLKEKDKPRPKRLSLCSTSIRGRGQRVYTSSTYSVEITYHPSASSSDRGFLIYYQAQKKSARESSRLKTEEFPTTLFNRQTTQPTSNTTVPTSNTTASISEEVDPTTTPQLQEAGKSPNEREKEKASSEAAVRKTLLDLLRSHAKAKNSRLPLQVKTKVTTKVTTEVTTEVTTKVSTPTTQARVTVNASIQEQRIIPNTEVKPSKVVSVEEAAKTQPVSTTSPTESFLRGHAFERVSIPATSTFSPYEKTTKLTPTKIRISALLASQVPPSTIGSTMPESTPKRTTTTKRTTKTSPEGPTEKSGTSQGVKKKKKKEEPKPASESKKEKLKTNSDEELAKTAQASIHETTSIFPETVPSVVNGSTTHVPFGSIFGREKPRDSGPWAAIVGGVIASIAGILLLVIIGIMIWEKRKKKCARTRMYDDVVTAQVETHARQGAAQKDPTPGRLPLPRNRIYENVQINGGFIPDVIHLKTPGTAGGVHKDNVLNEARCSDSMPGFGQVYQNADMTGDETDADKASYDEVSMDQIRITIPHPVPAKRQSLTLQRSTGDVSEDVYCEIGDTMESGGKPQPPVRTASRRDPPNHKPPKPPIKPKPKVGSLKRWLDKATGRHKEPEVSPDSLIDVQMVENEVYESEEVCKS